MAKKSDEGTAQVTHPDAEAPLEVSEDLVDAYVHGGWTAAEPTPQPTK